jgi:signal transduction histidine kinase
MLGILLDNLIRNVVNYASTGTEVRIALSNDGAGRLLIENQCQDISDQQWQLITQRFCRVPGSDGDGSGPGMSIVQRICELHGAQLTVGRRAEGDGFAAQVEFAPAIS